MVEEFRSSDEEVVDGVELVDGKEAVDVAEPIDNKEGSVVRLSDGDIGSPKVVRWGYWFTQGCPMGILVHPFNLNWFVEKV